jgi:hypothetical protein
MLTKRWSEFEIPLDLSFNDKVKVESSTFMKLSHHLVEILVNMEANDDKSLFVESEKSAVW